MRAQRIGKPIGKHAKSVRANKQRPPVAARKSALKFIFDCKQSDKEFLDNRIETWNQEEKFSLWKLKCV